MAGNYEQRGAKPLRSERPRMHIVGLIFGVALGLHLSPCTIGNARVTAQCGTFGVYENRETHNGRIISLNVVVLPAKHPTHRAIAEIAGGPGQSATEAAPALADGDFGRLPLRDRYDFLFVDARGMGRSNPFRCDFAPPGNPAAYFRSLWPANLVSACRRDTAATHDASRYNTNNAVDDLDDVRAALHYSRIVLDAGSYGTFFSFVYMRRHPQHVESAVLDGVTAPQFQALPGAPDGAQHALDDLVQKCRSDAFCNRHFPQFGSHFNTILQRLSTGTLSVPVSNPVTDTMENVALSKEVFVDQLRHILYSPETAAFVPFAIERAYGGDYAPLAKMVQSASLGMAQELDMAANLSYTCADFIPFVTSQGVHDAQLHSFTGDLRIRAQQRACSIWNVPAMPPAFNEPVKSNAPVLMLLGSDDPATPPQYGEAALKYLPNGRAAIVKGAGHGAVTPCTNALVIDFVRAQSAKRLDVTKCVGTLKLPPFAASMDGFP